MVGCLAVLAALSYSGAAVASKMGLQHVSPLGGVAISVLASAVAASTLALTGSLAVPLKAVGLFALAGLLHSALGRFLMMHGLARLNTSTYAPLQSSTHPTIAVLGGVLVLGEAVSWLRAAGIVAIVCGVWVVTRGTAQAVGVFAKPVGGAGGRFKWTFVLLPIGAGVAFGLGETITREALSLGGTPALGAAIGTWVSCAAWGLSFAVSRPMRVGVVLGGAKAWFVVHGVLTAVGALCSFTALQKGDVSIVSPIIAGQPALTLVLSWLFLRKIESRPRYAIMGTVGVVLGAVLVSRS